LEFKASRSHLGQSWWQKMQSLGLSKQNGKKDSEVSQFLKKIFGLSFLPPVEVSDCMRWNLYPIFRTSSEWNNFATTC
jgi:hypothetical protein